ncbi:ribonuclease H-like domain-containing protein [Tanacetum coccineum]
MKGIKREFSIARTPQQNGVAERRNRTLIEAARTMLVDSKLPTTFWAKAVNTACYVLNRVLIIKSHNKTPYELIRGRSPLIDFMKPFGCPVTIINNRDHLGKFDGKADEGFLLGIGPDWLFDVDSLTISMNYVPVVAGNQILMVREEDAEEKPTEMVESGASNKDGKDDQATRSGDLNNLVSKLKCQSITTTLNDKGSSLRPDSWRLNSAINKGMKKILMNMLWYVTLISTGGQITKIIKTAYLPIFSLKWNQERDSSSEISKLDRSNARGASIISTLEGLDTG